MSQHMAAYAAAASSAALHFNRYASAFATFNLAESNSASAARRFCDTRFGCTQHVGMQR